MATRRVHQDAPPGPRSKPATTPEAQENLMISLAVDLSERQLREGTASAQVITHYLKLGSSREKLEQEHIGKKNELMQVQMDTLASQKRVEELFADAIQAFSSYRPSTEGDEMDEIQD